MIAGILLAAGNSTRFGSHKLLHPLADGTPLVIAAVCNLRQGVDEVLAVVRPDDTALIELLQKEQVKVIACANAARGMGASLACGVCATPAAAGWLVALGDMPDVPPSVVTALAEQLRESGGIVAPSHEGRRGHPVGFSRAFFGELVQLDGDAGGRHLIAAHQDQVTLLPCAYPGILRDIDTLDDLASASSGD